MRKWPLTALVLSVAFMVSLMGTARAADIAKGKSIFTSYCASCHGPTGKGDGPAAAGLNPKPRDLSNTKVMEKLTDKYLADVISKGGPALGKSALMPAWGGTLKSTDIKNIIAFIRSLSKK